jgi:hypothetical protein
MSDLNNETGVVTFPVTMYVFILSYLAPVLAPYSEMLDVLSMMSMIKFASVVCDVFGNEIHSYY